MLCWHRIITRALGRTELRAATFSIARPTPRSFNGEKRTDLILGLQKAASPQSIAQGKHARAEPLAARARNAGGRSLLFVYNYLLSSNEWSTVDHSVFAQDGAAGACSQPRGHLLLLAVRGAQRCAMSWLADIFAQAELLHIVVDYLFWSPSPRHCMACGFRDLQTGLVFCRFLL